MVGEEAFGQAYSKGKKLSMKQVQRARIFRYSRFKGKRCLGVCGSTLWGSQVQTPGGEGS